MAIRHKHKNDFEVFLEELEAVYKKYALEELEAVYKKYGFTVSSCGCCDSPWVAWLPADEKDRAAALAAAIEHLRKHPPGDFFDRRSENAGG